MTLTSTRPGGDRRTIPAAPLTRMRRAVRSPMAYLAAGLVAVTLLIAGCGAGDSAVQASSAGPITVGIIADMTGSTKTIGSQFINGSEAAAKVFGRIDGRPVKFVVQNGGDFSASTTAANVIQLKTQDNVAAVLGMASSECEGAISAAGRVQIPMIGNSCSIQDVVGSNCNYWFINGGPSPAEGEEVKAPLAAEEATMPGI